MDWFTNWLNPTNVWLVPIYPLVAFFAILIGRGVTYTDDHGQSQVLFKRKEMAAFLTIGATLLGLIQTLPLVLQLLTQGTFPAIERNVSWLTAGNFTLGVGYLLDPMSIMMLFVVTFISLFIQIYTHGYMSHDKGYAKFFAYLALFNFSMLGLVLSTNLFQMYIFWELVGVSSFLLIGFWFFKPAAAKACVKAFLMNRIGDFGLLLGILAFLALSMGWWVQEYLPAHPTRMLLSFQGVAGATQYIIQSGVTPGLFALVAFLIFMGPMAKSAQVPLHTWLPDAMEGPTPISALIHAATMVAAGVYLVGRVYPVFQASEITSNIIVLLGCLTAVIAATIAITQVDIKKALAYSTVSQLGFMMVAMGVGAFSAGLFHLFTHAFFKAMLFLCSGSVIHACEDEQDMRLMGGLAKKLPVTHITYLVGCISISGFFLSGFWSKDAILLGASMKSMPVFIILAITATLTAFYMFRTYFMTFTGSYRGKAHVHHESPSMIFPLMVLSVPSVVIGFLLSGQTPWHIPSFESLIVPMSAAAHGAGHHADVHHGPISHVMMSILSLLMGATGLFFAYLFYGKSVLSADLFRKMFSPFYNLFSAKWYFDEIYQGLLSKLYMPFAYLSAAFDRYVIDGLVNSTGRLVSGSGSTLRLIQSGRVQTYVLGIFLSVVVLTLLFVYGLS
jgi:NAD(P)H-quinone oxidoreductase subunit 5